MTNRNGYGLPDKSHIMLAKMLDSFSYDILYASTGFSTGPGSDAAGREGTDMTYALDSAQGLTTYIRGDTNQSGSINISDFSNEMDFSHDVSGYKNSIKGGARYEHVTRMMKWYQPQARNGDAAFADSIGPNFDSDYMVPISFKTLAKVKNRALSDIKLSEFKLAGLGTADSIGGGPNIDSSGNLYFHPWTCNLGSAGDSEQNQELLRSSSTGGVKGYRQYAGRGKHNGDLSTDGTNIKMSGFYGAKEQYAPDILNDVHLQQMGYFSGMGGDDSGTNTYGARGQKYWDGSKWKGRLPNWTYVDYNGPIIDSSYTKYYINHGSFDNDHPFGAQRRPTQSYTHVQSGNSYATGNADVEWQWTASITPPQGYDITTANRSRTYPWTTIWVMKSDRTPVPPSGLKVGVSGESFGTADGLYHFNDSALDWHLQETKQRPGGPKDYFSQTYYNFIGLYHIPFPAWKLQEMYCTFPGSYSINGSYETLMDFRKFMVMPGRWRYHGDAYEWGNGTDDSAGIGDGNYTYSEILNGSICIYLARGAWGSGTAQDPPIKYVPIGSSTIGPDHYSGEYGIGAKYYDSSGCYILHNHRAYGLRGKDIWGEDVTAGGQAQCLILGNQNEPKQEFGSNANGSSGRYVRKKIEAGVSATHNIKARMYTLLGEQHNASGNFKGDRKNNSSSNNYDLQGWHSSKAYNGKYGY